MLAEILNDPFVCMYTTMISLAVIAAIVFHKYINETSAPAANNAALPVQYFAKEHMNIKALLGNHSKESMLRLGVRRWVCIRAADVKQQGPPAVTAGRGDVDVEMIALGVNERIRAAIPPVIARHFARSSDVHYVLLVQAHGTFPLGIFFHTGDAAESDRVKVEEAEQRIRGDDIAGFAIVNISSASPF